MKELNPGQIKIRNTGHLLLIISAFFLFSSLFFPLSAHIEASFYFAILMTIASFMLWMANYKIALWTSFLISLTFSIYFAELLLSWFTLLYQLNLNEIKVLISANPGFLLKTLCLIISCSLLAWLKTRLRCKTIENEIKKANIAKNSFWRYSTFVGIIVGSVVYLTSYSWLWYSIVSHTPFTFELINQANKKLKAELGDSAFFLPNSLVIVQKSDSATIVMIGDAYDGKRLATAHIRTKKLNKSKNEFPKEIIFLTFPYFSPVK